MPSHVRLLLVQVDRSPYVQPRLPLTSPAHLTINTIHLVHDPEMTLSPLVTSLSSRKDILVLSSWHPLPYIQQGDLSRELSTREFQQHYPVLSATSRQFLTWGNEMLQTGLKTLRSIFSPPLSGGDGITSARTAANEFGRLWHYDFSPLYLSR